MASLLYITVTLCNQHLLHDVMLAKNLLLPVSCLKPPRYHLLATMFITAHCEKAEINTNLMIY